MQLRAGLGGHESPVLLPSPGPSASPIKRQPHDDDSMEHESQEPAGRPKRRRIGYACDLCRLKKNRCDGDRPACGPCRGRRQECIYSPQRTRVSVTQEYVDSLRARNRALEESLATHRDRELPSPNASISEGHHASSHPPAVREDWVGQQSPYGHARSVTPGSRHVWLASDSSQRKPSRASNGSMRPPLPPKSRDDRSPVDCLGESSTFTFIDRVGSPATRKSYAQHQSHDPSLRPSSPSSVVLEDILQGGFMSTQRQPSGSMGNLFELPPRSLADRLVTSYFIYRHPVSTYLHEGTFRRRYERLWRGLGEAGDVDGVDDVAWLGLVNLVLAFGCDTSSMPHGTQASGSERDRVIFFERGKSLTMSGILQGGKVELVQALLLMGHFLHGSLEFNHCWTVVGLAVRNSQAMGLHLDPAQFTDDIVEQEVRKRVWWGCFALDRQISTKVGRPPIIKDDSSIRADLPRAVDDEYLNEESGFRQPVHIPAKLEYCSHVVSQCRLADKVLKNLYSNRTIGFGHLDHGIESITEPHSKVRLSDLLAMAIQLDGELVAWQQALPAHLHPDSDMMEWHFQRQRNVLLMRFLHARLLVHRQTLLFYASRCIRDTFQLDLARLCISRCISSAYEVITQMRLLRQKRSLSSFWHNSHYCFAALGVLLVYQKIDPQLRAEIIIPASFDLDNVIHQVLENLHRIRGDMHPLASRYVESFQHLQEKLSSLSSLSINTAEQGHGDLSTPNHTYEQPMAMDSGNRSQDYNSDASGSFEMGADSSGIKATNFGTSYEESLEEVGMDEQVSPEMEFDGTGFGNEFGVLQSVLLDSGEWPFENIDWQQQ